MYALVLINSREIRHLSGTEFTLYLLSALLNDTFYAKVSFYIGTFCQASVIPVIISMYVSMLRSKTFVNS